MRDRPVRFFVRGLRKEAAAGYIGVSETKFDELVTDGRMPKPTRIDRCRVWDVEKLDLAFDALGEEDGAHNPWDDQLGLDPPQARHR